VIGIRARPDPFGELSELRTRVDRSFDRIDGRERVWAPGIDVADVVRDILTVSGERDGVVEGTIPRSPRRR
jgi:hypothetical protein